MRDKPAPIDIDSRTFREIGHKLVDDVAELLESIGERPVAPALSPSEIRRLLPQGPVPEGGADPRDLLAEATELLFRYSTFNGHPRFFGYITAPAAPIGILGDFLATAVNPNVGGWNLSPIATEIELQTLRWIAELIGYPADCGGIFLSGGNMANIVCLLAARAAAMSPDASGGVATDQSKLRIYTSTETHTWIEKAADIAGLGKEAIRWLPVDNRQRLRIGALEEAIVTDRKDGLTPFFVIGTAGTTATGSIDPLVAIAEIARREGVWFHVDGAYGAPVAALPDAPDDFRAIAVADSVAIDPHKWLYAPLEAGVALVRDPDALTAAFAHHPTYYHFDSDEGETKINFYERGPQNSRGFRALKVWLGIRQVGRAGYVEMIRQDIALARELYDAVQEHDHLEAMTCGLSIATFAYTPPDLRAEANSEGPVREYLNDLNTAVLSALQEEGRVFLSNAVVGGRFALRACVVNFRTTSADVRAVPPIVVEIGRERDAALRPAELRR